MAKKLRLSQKERVVIILFCERYEGTRIDARRMDNAIDVIDRDGASDSLVTTPVGVQIPIESLSDEQEEFTFEDEPFKTLKVFFQDQRIPYSRRPDTVGRVILGVMDKFDGAEDVEL